ncbi:unnamed protein product [Paramecium sonneborni]|uniref:Uncharacterized protein n=1 Tax=Paramecium sonneborni TaxID=65129 RepID=A0A8S1P862_9CILI|nr:unnamed protein product [Paramecium sonneborni]
MFINKSKKPSLLYVECKSRDISRRNSRISDFLNDTTNKENSNQQSNFIPNTAKKIDRTIGSLNKMYKQAIQDQQNLQEQASMLIEDLNGKLLQRAELIGQVEELEELIEFHKIQSNFEFAFATKIEQLDLQIQQLKKQSSFKLSNNIADLIRDREQQHKILKEKINQETTLAMTMYLQQWGHQFEVIKNQYGNEVYQQVLKEQEQQINQLISQQYNKKIQGIILILRNHEKLEKAIQLNIDYVDTQLNDDIVIIKQTMDQKKQLVQNIRNNLLEEDQSKFQLLKRVEDLEQENQQLEQQLNEITMKKDLYQQEILNKQKTEEIYNEILTGFDCLSQIDNDDQKSDNSNSQLRSGTNILSNINKQTKKVLSNHLNKDDSLHFSQLQQYLQINSIDGETNSKCSSACQLSADDSLLQHFNELNLTLLQSEKSKNNYCNMPLQQSQQSQQQQQQSQLQLQQSQLYSQQSQVQYNYFNQKNSPIENQSQQIDFIRLQTITEEQLSSKREKSKMEQSTKINNTPIHQNFQNYLNLNQVQVIDNSSQSTRVPLTEQTKRFSNKLGQSQLQMTNCNEVTQKQISIPSPYMPLFFNNQPNNPQTQKSQQPQVFKFKEQNSLSEQISKHKKSKSFDSTANKDIQQKQLFCNISANNGQTYYNSKDSQYLSTKSNLLIPIEQEILKITKPLLKGVLIYKRFTSTKPNLTKMEFDPFTCQNPNICGYCPRIIALSQNFDKIEFKNQMRINQVDSSLQLDQIMRVIIPKTIQQSIQIKKQIQNRYILSQEERIFCSIVYWPMSIITQNEGRIELLFDNEEILESWQTSLIFLKDNIKTLQIINKKLKK